MTLYADNVHLDIIDGNRGRKTFDKGWELDRIAIVRGVPGGGYEKVLNATKVEGMPEIGDAHPALASAWLREITPEAFDTDTVKLRLLYSQYTSGGSDSPSAEQPNIEAGASVVQETTDADYQGNLKELAYTYPDTDKIEKAMGEGYRGVEWKINAEWSALKPQNTISLTRKEYVTHDHINWLGRNYVGKVNSGAWSLDTGSIAREWLCTAIVGRSNDGGLSFNITYSFQYRERVVNDEKLAGWDKKVAYRDKFSGAIPDDIDTNPSNPNSRKIVQDCVEIDFDNLNL